MIRHYLAMLSLLVTPAMPVMAQDIAVQSNRSRIQMIKDFDLRGDARSEFRQFKRKGEFFGAIYVNRPERLAGAYTNANSTFLADAYARTLCQVRSKNPDYCVLYAFMLPKNYDPMISGVSLSRAANKDFREYRSLQNSDRSGAFAVSDNGAVGYSWAEASPEKAASEALRKCAKSARKILRKTPEDLKPIVSIPSRQDCRLIHQSN